MMTIHIEKYYTSIDHLLKVFDKDARQMRFNAENITEYENWKKKTRLKLAEIAGLCRMQECDMQTQMIETKKLDGYIRQKIIIQTEPNVWMPFFALYKFPPGEVFIEVSKGV